MNFACSQLKLVGILVALLTGGVMLVSWPSLRANPTSANTPPSDFKRVFDNRLTPVANPEPILADYPQFIAPMVDVARLCSPPLVDDAEADLHVKAWRWAYNARAIIEIPNRLSAKKTAIIVVHPWGIEDGQGWRIPQPAGYAFGTPRMIETAAEQIRTVIAPLVASLRGQVKHVVYSLPGSEDAIRGKLYRSVRRTPTEEERKAGRAELTTLLNSIQYENRGAIPEQFSISRDLPVPEYFHHFPGDQHRDHYNGPGYWSLPIPLHAELKAVPEDVVLYDAEGYSTLRDFLKREGVNHVLLMGFHADQCLCSTAAGYENLRKDFNVFLVGDATQATAYGNHSPASPTNAAVAIASLKVLITQASWIRPVEETKSVNEDH